MSFVCPFVCSFVNVVRFVYKKYKSACAQSVKSGTLLRTALTADSEGLVDCYTASFTTLAANGDVRSEVGEVEQRVQKEDIRRADQRGRVSSSGMRIQGVILPLSYLISSLGPSTDPTLPIIPLGLFCK